jgi:hypothetical protein
VISNSRSRLRDAITARVTIILSGFPSTILISRRTPAHGCPCVFDHLATPLTARLPA